MTEKQRIEATDETLKLKRTPNGMKNIVVGQEVRVRTPEKDIFDVKVVAISEEFVELEILNQVVDIGNGKEMLFIGGTVKINATETEMGECSRYKDQEVKLVHKIVNNVSSMECEVEGKQYRTCEEGCPVWKHHEEIVMEGE